MPKLSMPKPKVRRKKKIWIPYDTRQWSVDNVCHFLKKWDLAMYIPNFKEHRIDGATLCDLTNDEIEDIGVKSFHVRKLRRCIDKAEFEGQMRGEGMSTPRQDIPPRIPGPEYAESGVAV